MNHVTLYEEYRLIERNEVAINRAWKGAHLLLFFLAFVFGSFCTFCFHMLMYLFDEKCVLFPKLLSLTSLRHNVIYEFIPSSRDLSSLPVDFLSTQWVEKSTCALPTYVPLVSGIFGLVWTTMFLMCSTGSRTLTGLQRPWRVLPPVFVFSLAMGALCVYSSAITHYGLQELCVKLGEITGSSTCTYAVNVATLTYERRIRGVYQATRLTIVSAWLHTFCWICSALLAAVRVLLGVDFQLVRVSVRLHGDVDRIMEQNETHIRTIFPDNVWMSHENETEVLTYTANQDSSDSEDLTELLRKPDELFDDASQTSELSLVPAESYRLAKISAYGSVPEEKQFIVRMVFDMLENLDLSNSQLVESASEEIFIDESKEIMRHHGEEEAMSSNTFLQTWERLEVSGTLLEHEYIAVTICNIILDRVEATIEDIESDINKVRDTTLTRRKLKIISDAQVVELPLPSTRITHIDESVMNITDEMKHILKQTADKQMSNKASSSKKSKKKTFKELQLKEEQASTPETPGVEEARLLQEVMDKEKRPRKKEKEA